MIKIKTFEVDGFGPFETRSSLGIDGLGRVLVRGDNRDTTAASSNGAGKTSLFAALTWCIYGKTVDGRTTDIVHRRAKSAQVILVLEDDDAGKSYRVTRRRTKSSGSLELYNLTDDRDESQSKVAATQEALERLVGADFDGWRSTVLFGQGDHMRFASPMLGDAARKQILANVLGLHRYEAARETARTQRERLRHGLADLDARRVKQVASISKLEAGRAADAAAYKAMEESPLSDYTLASSKLTMERATVTKTVDEQREQHDALVLEIEELAADVHDLEEAVQTASEAAATMAADARALGELAEHLGSTEGPCPTCGADREYDPERHEEAVKQHAEIVSKQRAHADRLKDARALLAADQRSLSTKRVEYGKLETSIAAWVARIAAIDVELGELKLACEGHAERMKCRLIAVEAAKEEIETLEHGLEEIDDERGELQHDIAHYDWWIKTGFGPKGTPSLAIELALPALNARTNRHLSVLSDGDISANWHAVAEGSSGKTVEVLTLKVTIEGIEDATPSGGQARKLELATEMALAEMSRDGGSAGGIDLLMIDEALDGLDAQGQAKVVSWLEGLGTSTIMVISHGEEIADDFDREITIVKEGSASWIETA